MDIVTLVIALIVIGVVLYLLNYYVMPALPIDPPMRAAIMALVAVIIILYLISRFLGIPWNGRMM